MRIADINRKTKVVVHISNQPKLPVYSKWCRVFAKKVAKTVKVKDVLQPDGSFVTPTPPVVPPQVTLKQIRNKLVTMEATLAEILAKLNEA